MQKSYKIGGLSTHTITSIKTGVYDGKIAGLYDLEETLGRGHFAVVKLARHVFTGEKVAVKVIDKSKLDSVSKAHLFQEVRCMKLVQHPNVVRLYEVIDTATKLYLILELGDGGDLYDYIMRHESGLSEILARDYFAQIVRAITYCHQLHVVHRDLKPENVVFFEKQGVVKLTDFGFSNKFSPGQKLETSCGSLAYSAPEILLGDSYDAPAVDVWSLGVILYMLVCGQAPFHEANDSETLTMIMDCKYTVPVHISKECKDLIARMLVRAPDKRATLTEIAAHPWLARTRTESIDILPLVSREQLTEEDHNLIVTKMVNGNIAAKEEIHECLDKNDYNHITATYFLLAERKLRFKRQEQSGKGGKRPENLAVPNNNAQSQSNKLLLPAPACLLTVPRTPGDVPQRSRKCSIVQEDEEEEDISSSGREDLAGGHNSLNRRGSRSEGRINVALQERLAEAERRKEEKQPRTKAVCNIKMLESRPRSAHETLVDIKLTAASKWKSEKSASIPETTAVSMGEIEIPTTIITQAATMTAPITQAIPTSPLVKYKTMSSASPSPQSQLNEIFEEGDHGNRASGNRQLVNRSRYTEQRRTKFHKTRTASCSSSDASDDDSENRKKRAHKMNTNTSAKPLQPRRDSHDDSSDSQEPGANGTATRTTQHGAAFTVQSNSDNSNNNKGTNGNETAGGRKHTTTPNGAMLGRRHKSSRRRSTETRLRESQSLNRITEEQDANNATANLIVQPANGTQKTKSFGAKLFGFTIGNGGGGGGGGGKRPASEHYSRKDKDKPPIEESKPDIRDEKENKLSSKKMRLLGRYLQVHKRIFMPIPNLFGRNKLYKARSCGSLTRDKITSNPNEVEALRARAVSVIRNSVGSTSDINQNMGATKAVAGDEANLVKNVTSGLSNMCAHLGPASKCSFC